MFQAANILSGQGGDDNGGRCGPQIQECWEFEHPRRDVVLDERGKYSERRPPIPLTVLRVIPGLPVTNSHNIRSATLTFHIPHAGVLHGLAGYFEAVLYGEIGLSIHPSRKEHISKDMLSWFPLFFPLKVMPAHDCGFTVLSPHRTLPPSVNPTCRLVGAVIFTEQFRTSSLHMAPNGSTTGVVRVVCGVVSAGAATARRNAECWAHAQG
jgi:hypothetical protein